MNTLLAVALALSFTVQGKAEEKPPMRITPVLLVDSIEACLPFWVDRLGFQKTAEVPEGDRLGFVMLAKDGADVMLQTWESARKDVPQAVPKPGAGITLFLVVRDLDDIMRRLKGVETLIPERTTFYGMREYGVRDPGGYHLILAQEIKK